RRTRADADGDGCAAGGGPPPRIDGSATESPGTSIRDRWRRGGCRSSRLRAGADPHAADRRPPVRDVSPADQSPTPATPGRPNRRVDPTLSPYGPDHRERLAPDVDRSARGRRDRESRIPPGRTPDRAG